VSPVAAAIVVAIIVGREVDGALGERAPGAVR
jgi:hypothetical protein